MTCACYGWRKYKPFAHLDAVPASSSKGGTFGAHICPWPLPTRGLISVQPIPRHPVFQMRHRKVVVQSPATIANFGPGFDSFGLCLESPSDRVTMSIEPDGERSVRLLGAYDLPTDPEKNAASFAAMRLAEMCGEGEAGFTLTLRKGMKPGSGIGSSAASSVGGALAMASLLGCRDRSLILEAAALGEELISGSKHFDNVASALHGGFTFVSGRDEVRVVRISPPMFQVVVLLPDIEVRTSDARKVLPKTVPLHQAVDNMSWAAGVVHSMMRKDLDALARNMNDHLSLPYRRKLIPGFDRVCEAALDAGALAVSIGGSGPAVFSIAHGGAPRIRKAMVSALKEETGLGSESFVTSPGKGARVVSLS
jgi:homoserine kinase